jgi:hypothetical protein
MTFNSQDIIQDIRAEYDMLIEFVTGEQAHTATADHIERGLFKLLLKLGAKLLTLFFVMRSQAYSREPLEIEEGQTLPYLEDKKRTYFSIFGRIALWRPYFYKKGSDGQSPLDAELSLGSDRYSDFLREIAEYLGVYVVYHKTTDILERLLELNLSTRVQQQIIADDAEDVEAYYEQKPPPAPEAEANILVIQADGKGVPLILETPPEPKVRLGKGQKRGRKKESIVTSVYTISALPRTPEEVVASYYAQNQADEPQKPTAKRPKPHNKHVWATLEGKDTALDRLAQRVAPRQGDHIQHQVALCDGCEALQSRIEARFSDFSLILDFIHANEYLWDVANKLLGETNEQRFEWMSARTLRMLSGETAQLIADFRQLAQDPQTTAAQREQLTKTANYFERNLPYMDYPTCLANGWPIASGVIEGACRHFVKDRFELSGMRWNQQGAENLLRLRAVAENDDWDAYHTFRKQQRHVRLYSLPFPNQVAIEVQALNCVPSVDAQPVNLACQAIPAQNPGNLDTRQGYYSLPLAA